MKWSLNITGLCYITGHPSTGHATDFNMCGKDTTYASISLLLTSTPQVCVMIIPWDLSIWWRSDNDAITSLYYSQLTLVLFRSLNVELPPVSIHLYAASHWWPYMNLGVKTPSLYFPDSSVIQLSWIFVPPTSVLPASRWNCGPLCGHCLHRRLCCAPPPPILVHSVPPVGHRIPSAHTTMLNNVGENGSPWGTPLSVMNNQL